MSTENSSGFRHIAILNQVISISLLLLHFYYYDYGLFYRWHLTNPIGDHILEHIQDTGLFLQPIRSKALALFFLGFSLISSTGRKDGTINKSWSLGIILLGMAFYCGSTPLPITIGYLLILIGGARLSRTLKLPWSDKDPFGREQAGFPQEEQRRPSDFGLYLKAHYTYKGRQRDSWINLINPRRGVLILGSPGCGKTWFIIEPLIRQLIEKRFSLFVYDFKYDTLTRLVYNLWMEHEMKRPNGLRFYSINFSDLSTSARCNVLQPETLEWLSDAMGASRTLFLSMNKTWIHHQGDFFVESPISFLAAVIWFLRKYKDGIYCTLPHAIELALLPYDKLFPLLESEPEIRSLINPFVEAYRNKNMEMLDSQIASAKIPLNRLSSPDIYYILTGNDLTLDINNLVAPKILCLGGDPPRQEALGPVLSLYIDRLNKLVNRPGQYPCALVCDEFATVRAYSMTTTIATARSNNIIPIIAVQDLSQLRTQYSRDEADLILNITGNLLCGQVGGETARWISERFPKVLQDRATVSTNSNDTSISRFRQWEPSITPATIFCLSSGEFVGFVADDPGDRLQLKAFHSCLDRKKEPLARTDFKTHSLGQVSVDTVSSNYLQIKQDILNILIEFHSQNPPTDPSLHGEGFSDTDF